MLLLNFSHPLTSSHLAQIEALTDTAITRTITIPVQFDEQELFIPQLHALLAEVGLTPTDWQNQPLLVVLPSLNFISALLLAELHGRMGYFPPIVRMRPIANRLPRAYEVAEILDLQQVREVARRQR